MAAGQRRPSGNNPYKCPGRVQVAGALYVGFGVLFFVGLIVNLFLPTRRPDDTTFLDLLGCLFGSILGIAFFTAGRLILSGTIRDVLVPGVGTLLVAVHYTAVGLYFLIVKADHAAPNPPPVLAGYLMAGYAFLGFASVCVVTAMLALSARGRYRRWAAAAAGDPSVAPPRAAADVEQCFPGVVCPECEKARPLAIWQGGLWCRACTVWVVRPTSPPAEPTDSEQPEGREQEPG